MPSSFSVWLEGRQVTHPEQQRMWGALCSSCIRIDRPYEESLTGPINKCLAGFEHQQRILSMRSQLRFKGCFLQGLIEQEGICPAVPSTWSRRNSWRACPLMGIFQVFHCDFSVVFCSMTWLALLCMEVMGSGSGWPEPGVLDQGATEGLQRSLTGKRSWRQAVGLGVGVLTSLVLGACDIHHSACTGKRRGNSCESKEYGTSSQSML